jgi:hypothetical protein
MGTSGNDVRIFSNAWIADFPAPGGFIDVQIPCGAPANFAELCDRSLDRQIAVAQALQTCGHPSTSSNGSDGFAIAHSSPDADQTERRAGIPNSSMMASTRSPMSSLIGRTCSTGRSLGSPTSQSR